MFLHFKNLHNNSDNQFARNKLTALNKLVRSGSYMAKNIIGENEITFESSLWHSVPAKKLPVTVSQTLASDAPGNCATTNAKGGREERSNSQTVQQQSGRTAVLSRPMSKHHSC